MAEAMESLPEKSELEKQQLYLTNEKLKLDALKVQREIEPDSWWSKLAKNVLAIGGAVTLVATLYGVWDSYDKTIRDRDHTRVSDARVRFEDAIKRLESSSTISKLIGVSVLNGYLDKNNVDLHRQVLFALAGLISTEKDLQTQRAVSDLLREIPKNGPIEPADWSFFQDMLVSQSRALVEKGDLLHNRRFGLDTPLKEEELAAQTVGKLIAMNIRRGVVPDYLTYSHIYCVDCNFQDVQFPNGVDFSGAVLDRANFSSSTLEFSVFDNAELLETKFVSSSLKHAKFRTTAENQPTSWGGAPLYRTAYIDHIAARLTERATVTIVMPDFSCSKLQGADFTRHSLFPGVMATRREYVTGDESKTGWYRTVSEDIKDEARKTKRPVKFGFVGVKPPKFIKANLSDTKLEESSYFAFKNNNSADNQNFMSSADGVVVGDVTVWNGYMNPDIESEVFQPQKAANVNNDILEFQNNLRWSFYLAQTEHASLPREISAYLKQHPPDLGDTMGPFRGFAPEHDPDLDCEPRLN